MLIKNTRSKYGIISQIFHWGAGLIVIALLGIGLYMGEMPDGPDKFFMYFMHKSFGITILGLMILRVLWRFMNQQPALPLNMGSGMKFASRLEHFALYILVFTMALSGWFMSSSAGYAVNYFGLFEVPNLIGENQNLKGVFAEIHEIAAWGLIALLVLHITAALYHHFIRGDDILKRMVNFKGE